MLKGNIKIDIADSPYDGDEDVDYDPIVRGINIEADDFCPDPGNVASPTKVFRCDRPEDDLTVTVTAASDGSLTFEYSRSVEVVENTLSI